jgi:hypothetical protein
MSKSNIFAVLWLVGGLALAAFFGLPDRAEALSDPLSRWVSWEVSCGTAATSLKPAAGFLPRKSFEITNGATEIFIGGANVNATTLGYSVAAAGKMSLDGAPSGLYCITASGSSTVNLLGAD